MVPLTNIEWGIVGVCKVIHVGYPKGLDGHGADPSQQLGNDHHGPHTAGLLLRVLGAV